MSLLSTQQEMIVKLAANGLTNKEIAKELNVGPRAVETQLVRIRRKLGTTNKTETIATATKMVAAKADKQTEGLAIVAKWMQGFMIAFDSQYRIMYANEACQETFDLGNQNADVGRGVWKTITPGMAARERLRPLSANWVLDYEDHVTIMLDSKGRERKVIWSSHAKTHPADAWAWWAVGWEVSGSL